MLVYVDQEELTKLLEVSLAAVVQLQITLLAASDAAFSQPNNMVIRANYRALSQILDDLVRITDTADQIFTSLTQTPEAPV